MAEKVNLTQKLSLFDERWSPKIVAELNDMQVKVVKVEGEFLWHHHDQEDELFLVVSGRPRMDRSSCSRICGASVPATRHDSCVAMSRERRCLPTPSTAMTLT